ncbi:MAG: glycosyltransferase, partial [Cyanobacteriota bacterium]
MDNASLEQTEIALMELRSHFAIQEAICMIDLPFWQPLALKLKKLFGWKLVYDCMDHIAGFSNTTAEILALETALSQSSDLVITTSRLLLTEQSKHNTNCIFVPNASEFDHFRFPFSGVPVAIKDIPHPVIGYYGAIADWFDTHLIAEIAKAAPNWSIVLIGDTCFSNLAPIADLPNIHLLGEQPYQILPSYLHQFDVCIIPFKKTPLTDSTNPVKLFEFLSAGKPVVATDLNELGFYQDHIRLASSLGEWMAAIQQALEDYSPEKIQMRMDFARENTWEERVIRIDQAVQSLYPQASILILTYNNLDYTRLCLDSVFQNTAYPNFEVIVVDNASNDGTVEYLKCLE